MAKNRNVSVGFDAFDRANDSYEFDGWKAQGTSSFYACDNMGSINDLACSIAPTSYATKTMAAVTDAAEKAVAYLSIGDDKFAIKDVTAGSKIDTLGEKFEELSAAIKRLGKICGGETLLKII